MSFVSPVQHKIPSSNDYKNINITNFKGTSYSDNLFDGKSSGCSESENIYINEQNILAVRPRLQHETSFENVKEILKVESLASDEMLYYVIDNNDKKHIIISDKKTAGKQQADKDIVLNVDIGNECTFLIDGDGKYICVSNNGLYEIDLENEYLIKIDTDNKNTYVPTLRTNMTFGNEVSGNTTGEQPNLLSNKYYNEYRYSLNFNEEISKNYIDNRKFDLDDVITIEKHEEFQNNEYPNYNIINQSTSGPQLIQVLEPNTPNTMIWYGKVYDNTIPKYYQTITQKRSDGVSQLKLPDKPDSTQGEWRQINNFTLQNTKRFNIGKDEVFITGDCVRIIPTKTTEDDSYTFDMLYRLLIWEPINGKKLKVIINVPDIVTTSNDFWGGQSVRIGVNISDKYIHIFSFVGQTYLEMHLVHCAQVNTSEVLHKWQSTNGDPGDDGYYSTTITTSKASLLELETQDPVDYISDVVLTDDGLYITTIHNYTSSYSDVTNYTKLSFYKYDILDNRLLQLLTQEYYGKLSNYEAIRSIPITKTRWLFVVVKDLLGRYDDSDLSSLIIYDNQTIKVSQDVIAVYNLTNNTFLSYSDDRYSNANIYKIPNSTSMVLFKYRVESYTIPNSSNKNMSIELDIYLATNYMNETSGIFKHLKTLKWTHVGVNFVPETLYITIETWANLQRQVVIRSYNPYMIYNPVIDDWSFGWLLLTFNDTVTSITEIADYKHETPIDFSQAKILDNRIWLWGSSENPNRLQWSMDTSAFYIPENYEAMIGQHEPITNVMQLTNNSLAVFQKNTTTVLSEDDNGLYLLQKTLKTSKGCLGKNQAIIIPTTNYPLVINDDSASVLMQSGNNVVEDSIFQIITEDIFEKFSTIQNKENIKTHSHGYYIYLYWPTGDNKFTNIWCLDCRSMDWFKWTLPINAIHMYESEISIDQGVETETRVVTQDGEYTLTSINNFKKGQDDTIFNEDIDAYVDVLDNSRFRRIPWKWKSRIQTLGTVNYLKKIVNLQFIFSDKVRKMKNDGVFTKNNSMFFKVKTYRKKSQLLNGNFSSHLDGVGIQKIKVRLPKCDFAEIELSNYSDDNGQLDHISMFSNGEIINLQGDSNDLFEQGNNISMNNIFDRLHLIGITLKILLSEGLNG